jgi:predicted MFS family arabinose efflux permease
MVAGLAALYPFFETAPLTLAAALVQLGFGQAISIASQTALVTEYGSQLKTSSGTVLGLFRLVERTGNALGPIAAAAVLATAGFEAASLLMGGLVVTGVTAFFLIEKRMGARQEATGGDPK